LRESQFTTPSQNTAQRQQKKRRESSNSHEASCAFQEAGSRKTLWRLNYCTTNSQYPSLSLSLTELSRGL
jgi:hypothetical protein